MASRSVAQAQLLGAILCSVVSRFRPRSLAILGAAGGNGLELVDPAIVRRVVAVDSNPHYMALCASRYGRYFLRFEPVLQDLSQGPPGIDPVECIFAGLVLEYLNLERFYAYLPSLVTDCGIFAVLLQLPSPRLPEVSVSPFPSLTRLGAAFSFVSPAQMHRSLCVQGFVRFGDDRYDPETGKFFYYASYQLREPSNRREPERSAHIGLRRCEVKLGSARAS